MWLCAAWTVDPDDENFLRLLRPKARTSVGWPASAMPGFAAFRQTPLPTIGVRKRLPCVAGPETSRNSVLDSERTGSNLR